MDRTRPEDFVGQPLPDLMLTADDGTPCPLRRHVGHGPLVLFFLLRNGTPG